jgi:hypothetical protein
VSLSPVPYADGKRVYKYNRLHDSFYLAWLEMPPSTHPTIYPDRAVDRAIYYRISWISLLSRNN